MVKQEQYQASRLGRQLRGRLEIANSILSVCLSGDLRTHVMFQTNLSNGQLMDYERFLVSKGLLQRTRHQGSARTVLTTTQRGKEFLETFERLYQLLESEGESNESAPTLAF